MKFLKSNLKVIIGFIVGAILTGGIVYAATSANQVAYTTSKNSEINSVADALNDLYNKSKNNGKSGTVIIPSGSSNYIELETGFLPNYIMLKINGAFTDHTYESYRYLTYNTSTSKFDVESAWGDIYTTNNNRYFGKGSGSVSCSFSNNKFIIPINDNNLSGFSCTWLATL